MEQEDRHDLTAIRDEWLAVARCTEPADRRSAESGVWEAFRIVDRETPALMFIWVQSPMAGVLASTSVGFALGDALKDRMTAPLEAALSADVPAAQRVRREVDASVWDVARTAVHRQIAAELTARSPAWERWRHDISNYAWHQVWQTVGDEVYGQGWEQQAGESEELFETNLLSWADAMTEGQFSAGTMAQLDALHRLEGLDTTPFAGLQRVARSSGWWWGFQAGAILCERPTRFEVSGEHVAIEFRDGWAVRT